MYCRDFKTGETPNDKQTAVQAIQKELKEEDESKSSVKYDVMFQNKEIERTFEQTNIQDCLHTPSLILDKKLLSLHEVS